MRRVLLLALMPLVAATGCEKLARNMYDGAKLRPDTARHAGVQGTVERSRGVAAMASSAREGDAAERDRLAAEAATAMPQPVSDAMRARGRERYGIYCEPCHSPLGDGDGFITRRGFPHPPSYTIARLREAPDRHFYDVISHGYGVMAAYGDRVAPADRWAIVAHIRELQRVAPQQAAAASSRGAS